MYNTYLSRYNTINNINSPLSMQLSSDIIGNQIIMQVDVEVTGDINHSNNKVVFGVNYYHEQLGEIRVGDQVLAKMDQ